MVCFYLLSFFGARKNDINDNPTYEKVSIGSKPKR